MDLHAQCPYIFDKGDLENLETKNKDLLLTNIKQKFL